MEDEWKDGRGCDIRDEGLTAVKLADAADVMAYFKIPYLLKLDLWGGIIFFITGFWWIIFILLVVFLNYMTLKEVIELHILSKLSM